jgi:cyanophycinase
LGSGEFTPWHTEVDRWLLDRSRGDGSVVILPTASAPEGDAVFTGWAEKGLAHYDAAKIPAEVLEVRSRSDADREDFGERIGRASMIFFSGGNPWYLAQVLDGSLAWRTIVSRLDDGLAYAGCSAGVACLTERTYDSDTQELDQAVKPGLGLFKGLQFGPHWDMLDVWVPGVREMIVALGGRTVGLDEDTAMVGDGTSWTVHGRQRVHVRDKGSWSSFRAGQRFELPV